MEFPQPVEDLSSCELLLVACVVWFVGTNEFETEVGVNCDGACGDDNVGPRIGSEVEIGDLVTSNFDGTVVTSTFVGAGKTEVFDGNGVTGVRVGKNGGRASGIVTVTCAVGEVTVTGVEATGDEEFGLSIT